MFTKRERNGWTTGRHAWFWTSTVLVAVGFVALCAYGNVMQTGCGPNTRNTEGDPKPIPNDPQGRKGWLGEVQIDDQGNKIEIWCIEIQGGVGNSFGFRYVPKNCKPRWIGRCAFVGGQNTYSKDPNSDADRNGIPDGWSETGWTSEDDAGDGGARDDDGLPGKNDFDWVYKVPQNLLKRWETLNGVRIDPNHPEYTGPAPEDFGGLFDETGAGNDAQDEEGQKAKPVVKVKVTFHEYNIWSYELRGNDITEFSPTIIQPGDAWAMAVNGVTLAYAPPGWTVAYEANYVMWIYGGPSHNLSYHGPLKGFDIISTAPEGVVHWLSFNGTEQSEFGFAATVEGPTYYPAPETGACLWLLEDGRCQCADNVDPLYCESSGGVYQGEETGCLTADLNKDCRVNLMDVSILAQEWLIELIY